MSSIWRPVRERAPARSLMVVVAHPGDEAFGFAGAIASAATEGAYVVVVCVTRGWFDPRLTVASPLPGGKNRDVKDAAITWRNLDTVREDELRRSVALLGVRVVRMLDYAEGDLDRVD
ncbi:MAG TPA: PIG-L family deacetylase, partial [Candidatus Limnocylindria bacterium]